MTSVKLAGQLKCSVCAQQPPELPVNSFRYCKGCWAKKRELAEQCRHQLNLRRIHRGVDVERYLIFPRSGLPALGEIIAIREMSELTNLVAVIDPRFDTEAVAYKLNGDNSAPETWADILIDALVEEVIESWGGGKWLLTIYRGDFSDELTYEGEI